MDKNEITQYITQSLYILLKSNNYEKITMDMISKKAGVSRRTIYRYFDNKQQVLNAFFDDVLQNYKQTLDQTTDTDSIILSSFEFIFENAEIFVIAYKNKLLGGIISTIREIVKQNVLLKQDDAKTWSKEYTEYYVSFTTGGIYNILYEWLKHDGDKSPQEVFEIYKKVICDLSKRLTH